jgi:putative transposase
VSLEANTYSVDPSLVGRRVELRYDPAELSMIEVFHQGQPAGVATPFVIGRHTHRAVPQAARPPAESTGVDYLGLVATAHEAETVGPISFTQLPLFHNDNDDDGADGGLVGARP